MLYRFTGLVKNVFELQRENDECGRDSGVILER
jgi:hypothetical protein